VVFLGIDGVPYDLIDDHPDVFEHLHRIADAGTAGRIDSIVPPESSACWPSLTAKPASTASRTERSAPTRRTCRWGVTFARRACGIA
jgi:hypothetical protein